MMNKNNYKTYKLYNNRKGINFINIIFFLLIISFFTQSCSSKKLVTLSPDQGNFTNEKQGYIEEKKFYEKNKYITQREIERSGRIQEKVSQITMPQKTEDIVIRVLYLPYAKNSNVFNSFKEAFILVEEGRWVYPDINNSLDSKQINATYNKSTISTPLNKNKNINYGKVGNTPAPKFNNKSMDIIEHNSNVYKANSKKNNTVTNTSTFIVRQNKIQRENLSTINNNSKFYFGRKRNN